MIACTVCGKMLSCPNSMYRHRKLCHQNENVKPIGHGSKRCGLCDSSYPNMSLLCSHLQTDHQENAIVETREFQNVNDFIIWKKSVAKEGKFDWANSWKRNGQEANVCNRSGTYDTKKNPKRAPRHIPSIKMNFDCSCFMNGKPNDNGGMTVTYCLHHYGHSKDAALLHISKETEGAVAAMIRDNRDPDYILDHIQGEESELAREDLFSKDDIKNIVRRLELDISQKDPIDTESVEMWVKEAAMEKGENSPFFYYRHEGIEISLGISTKHQLMMLIRFGHRIVASDSTHQTTGYNLKLITVMVDNREKGYPVAWLITNSETTAEMKRFFRNLRDKVGDIQTKFFMSDCAVQFWDGWSDNFSAAGTTRLWCSWHVQKNFRENIRSKLKDKSKFLIVKAMLSALMKETNKGQFCEQVTRVKTKLDEWNETEIINYLDDYYLKDSIVPLWAYYARTEAPTNTNTLLESFHRYLKCIVMKCKVNKRADRLLQILLHCAELYETNYAKDCVSRRIGNNNRWDEMHHRHRMSWKMIGKCEMELVSEGKKWRVQSESDRDIWYDISKINDNCECIVVCRYTNCNVCRCSYNCTCYDFLVKHASCKHIHLIYQSFLFDQPEPEPAQIVVPSPEPQPEETPETNINILKRKRQTDTINRAAARNKVGELSALMESVSNPEIFAQAMQKIDRVCRFLAAKETVRPSRTFEIDATRGPSHPHQNLDSQKRFIRNKVRPKNSDYAKIAQEATEATASIHPDKIQYCAQCFKTDDSESDKEIPWIGCTKCNKWYHRSHFENIEDEETFSCDFCIFA